jgi:maltose/moltooligosaccharide transporter
MSEKSGMEKYYGITFVIGLGFFTMGLMDPLYDTYVPIFLSNFLESKGLIGSIMTLDNIFAVFMIPVVSAWSDRTRTRIGRRMPWIIVTLPLSALLFGVLPFSAINSLLVLVILIFFLNLFKQAARGPVVALMPDSIPGEYRSEANGVINTMGGIAAIVGTVLLAPLMDVSINLPFLGETKNFLPFPIAAVLVIVATLMLFLFVKEKQQAKSEEKTPPVLESLKNIVQDKDPSTLLILISLFLWFLGYQGVLPFIGLYSVDVIGVSKGIAGLAPGMVAIAYAVFAIPSGIIAHKIGRKKVIRISLIGLTVITALLAAHFYLISLVDISQSIAVLIFFLLLFIFGIFWGSVVTNSFPMLWQMATFGTMGIFTGLYYTFSQTAAIAAPPVTGYIIDIFGFQGIFIFASICMLGAFFTMFGVRKGEPEVKKSEADEA